MKSVAILVFTVVAACASPSALPPATEPHQATSPTSAPSAAGAATAATPKPSVPLTDSWVKTGSFPVVGVYSGIALDQERPGRIYLFVENVGVVWTVDGGSTWRNLWCVNPHAIYSVVHDPSNSSLLHLGSNGQVCVADTERGTKVREAAVGGPANGSMIAHGGNVYAATQDGIFWSKDQWQTKAKLATPGAPSSVASLAFDRSDPNVMYLGSRVSTGVSGPGSGVYKTSDGGRSWSLTQGGLPDIRLLAPDPSADGVLYAVGFDGMLYGTTNAGTSWTQVLFDGRPELAEPRVTHVYPLAEAVYIGTAGAGVYRSADRGLTWSQLRFSDVGPRISTYPVAYRDYVTEISSAAAEPSKIYVTTGDGLFTVVGDTKQFVRVELPNGPSGLDSWNATGWSDIAAAPSDPSVVYAVDRCGQDAYRSTDGGQTWQAIGPAGSGLDYLPEGSSVKSPREEYPSTASHTYGMRVAVDPSNSQKVWLASNAGLFTSSDGGTSWERRSFKDPLGNFAGCPKCYLDSSHLHGMAAGPVGTSTLYVGVTAESAYGPRGTTDGPGGYIFKSADGGRTWTESSKGIPAPAQTSVYAMVVHPSDPDVVYFGTSRHDWGIRFKPVSLGVYRSADGGSSWSSAGLESHDVNALAVDPRDPAVLYVATDQGLFKTLDGGTSWKLLRGAGPLAGGRAGAHAVAVSPRSPDTVMAGLMGEGLFISRDAGATWNTLNRELKDVVAISIAGEVVYVATKHNGIFRGPMP